MKVSRQIKKRTLALLLTTTTAMTLGFTGCGNSNNGSSSAHSTKSADAKSESTDTNDTFSGYPLKTDQSLSVWSSIMAPQKSYTSYTESPWHTGLAKETGVDAEWTFPTAGTDGAQAFNLMLANEKLPDIIIYSLANDADQYIDEGIIRDLTDELPKKAPAYWKFLQDNPYYKKSVMSDSGKFYGFGTFRESEWNAAYTGPVIRKDWLDECGLSEPKTMADWDNVLRTFKDKYDAKLAFSITRMNPGLAGAYNTSGSFARWPDELFYLDDNDKVQFSMDGDGWKDYMTQLHTWYKDGLIDSDSITIDDAGMRTKALNGKVGLSITSISQLSNWIGDAKSQNSGANWVGVSYPVVNEGDTIMKVQMEDTVRNTMAVITTACPDEKVDLALRWLDYLFTEEGIRYTNFGTERDTYTMDGDTPRYTDKVVNDPEGMSEALDKYTGSQWQNIGVQNTEAVKQKCDPIAIEAVDIWLKNQESKKHIFPNNVTKTTAESNEATEITNRIQTYVQEMSFKFMTGDESLDHYDKYSATLKDMGLDKLLEIQQQAYERFNNR